MQIGATQSRLGWERTHLQTLTACRFSIPKCITASKRSMIILIIEITRVNTAIMEAQNP
jgi:hypothetical protein